MYSLCLDNIAQRERERHDKVVEKLKSAQAAWSKKRTQHLDWINAEKHAVDTFRDVDYVMQDYSKTFGPEREPQLSDFYTPSDNQPDYETAFIIAGTAGLGLLVYKFL